MLIRVKQCIEQNDIRGLHYIFAEALEADPTFEKYQEDYDVCKKVHGFLEEYKELQPLLEDQAAWNEDYWVQLKLDQKKNFSDKRMEHMKRVALVVRREKAARLLAERQSAAPEPVLPTRPEPVQQTEPERMPRPARAQVPPQPASVPAENPCNVPVELNPTEEAQKRELEAEKRRQQQVYKEQVAHEKAQREEHNAKKSRGIVLGFVILLAVIAVVIFLVQGNPKTVASAAISVSEKGL